MKRLMLVGAMVLGLAGMSFAQTSANHAINVNIEVLKSLSITNPGNADFGITYAGVGSVTLNPNTPAAGQTAGTFQVAGEPDHSINVSYTFTSPAPLTYSPTVVGDSVSTSQSTASSVGASASVNLNTSGDYYFWVGGTMSGIASGITTGTYQGTLTLTVSY